MAHGTGGPGLDEVARMTREQRTIVGGQSSGRDAPTIRERASGRSGLLLPVVVLVLRLGLATPVDGGSPPSRAAWWLSSDGVAPVADLINTAKPGALPEFADRVGRFEATAEGRALRIAGDFPKATIWRFDLTTFDGQFDMRRLYVPWGKCAFPDDSSIWTRRLTRLLGDAEKGRTYTGPWEIFKGKWLVPTARVALDGAHVYTSWFDLPSLDDQAAGRVYASFALDIAEPGKHAIRVSFDDFVYGTRWRPRRPGDQKPPVTRGPNPLRPHHIASIAIGIDERVRALEVVSLKPSLRGKHPRLSLARAPRVVTGERLSADGVERMLVHVDPDRGEPWEYSIDAESMASGNDMDAGRKALGAAIQYDAHVARLRPPAKAEWDRLFRKRLGGLYTFFVFQRNYHPTGYAQNHSSATVVGLVGGGLVWEGPEADKWLRWAVMTCRKRIELYGRDGGHEWMNEARAYGLGYFQQSLDLLRDHTGLDLTKGESFFANEWRYAVHHAPAFPTTADRIPQRADRRKRGRSANVPVPQAQTAENTPTHHHFADVDQVFMRSDWGASAWRARLWAGSVFGKEATPIAKRYNWAHCRVNQGSFVLARGQHQIILEPGMTRTYRKSAANNNCILINGVDQWGGGQVWHPCLRPDQIARIAFFADGALLAAARVDLKNSYPPEAKVRAASRCLIHIKPDLFLLFDRVEPEGQGNAEWRFHAPFVEPATPSSRFTVFGFESKAGPMRDRSQSYDEAFTRVPDAACQVAFLTPGVKATVGMTDVYYRWSQFSRPVRHLRVVREGDGPLTLLTAFGPAVTAERKGNVVHGTVRGRRWVALIGGGSAGGLRSDAHVAMAVEAPETGRREVMRFGGRTLVHRGVAIESAAEDVHASIRGKQPGPLVETIR